MAVYPSSRDTYAAKTEVTLGELFCWIARHIHVITLGGRRTRPDTAKKRVGSYLCRMRYDACDRKTESE